MDWLHTWHCQDVVTTVPKKGMAKTKTTHIIPVEGETLAEDEKDTEDEGRDGEGVSCR